jgi:hypothetical protein
MQSWIVVRSRCGSVLTNQIARTLHEMRPCERSFELRSCLTLCASVVVRLPYSGYRKKSAKKLEATLW